MMMVWYITYEESIHVSWYKSDSRNGPLGVPQGSVLSPVLFLLYSNNLTNSISDLFLDTNTDDSIFLISDKSEWFTINMSTAIKLDGSSLEILRICKTLPHFKTKFRNYLIYHPLYVVGELRGCDYSFCCNLVMLVCWLFYSNYDLSYWTSCIRRSK